MSSREPRGADAETIEVEVVLAWPDRSWRRSLRLPSGSTLRAALDASEVDHELGDQRWTDLAVGVFGRLREVDSMLADADRIELYRPLTADPKDARRRRARKLRK